jgi:hypothetical protein
MTEERKMVRRPILRTTIGALLVLLAFSGCTSTTQSAEGDSARRDRYVLTEDDLQGMDRLSALEAIRRLRPQWLQYRGTSVLVGTSREGLRVYVDRQYFGEAESLSTIMVRVIREIRFLDARQATLRYGTDHTVGAIVITSGGD